MRDCHKPVRMTTFKMTKDKCVNQLSVSCNKIPEISHFKGEKAYFGYSFGGFRSWLLSSVALGLWQHSTPQGKYVADKAYFPHGSQEAKKKKRVEARVLISPL